MPAMEPIRDVKKIQDMLRFLKGSSERDALLFRFGVNTGLRISDIIPIKYSDIFSDAGRFKDHMTIKEKKTGKIKRIKLNDTLKVALKSYVQANSLAGDDYIFRSRKGGHIDRIQAWRILKNAANSLNIQDFGTHTLRKTWGYHTYKASRYNIGLIMDMFNHHSERVTLRYIGISQDQKDELYSLVQF